MEITDRYLKPNFFQALNQAEFRIPKNKIYSNNIYLEKIGFINSAGNLQYNSLAGALGVIKSAILLDNGVEIDSCKNCGALTAFKNKLRQTKRIINKLDPEKSARTAFSFKSDIDTSKDITSQNIGPIDSELLKTTEQLTEDAIVPLSFFFPILNGLSSVDTNLFTDLRVRLEFSSDRFDLFNVQSITTYSQIVPVLRLQEIEDPKLAASMKIKSGNIPWMAYEHDRYVIPSNAGSATGVEQTTNVRLNGIRNKSIGRVLIQKGYATTGAETTTSDYGNFASRSLFKEKIQVRVNGSNLFAEGGIGGDKVMDIIATTTDAWGEYTLVPYEAEYGKGPGAYDADYSNWEVNTYVDSRRLNKGAYIGFNVQNKANDFFIEHKRTCVIGDTNLASMGSAGSASLAQLNVNVYFEVKKNLMVKDNKYMVQFV
jgi:hypothetical protein